MSADEDQENLFQILAARTTWTEDDVLKLARPVEEKNADKKFFAPCHSLAMVFT